MRNDVKLNPAGGGKSTGSGNVMTAGKWNTTISVRQNGEEIGQKKVAVTAKQIWGCASGGVNVND